MAAVSRRSSAAKKAIPDRGCISWYSPRQGNDTTVRELAFNQRFKLYRNGDFFDLGADRGEKHPLKVAALEGEAAAAAKLLQGALDQFREARPPQLDQPNAAPGKAKGKAGNRGAK